MDFSISISNILKHQGCRIGNKSCIPPVLEIENKKDQKVILVWLITHTKGDVIVCCV